jgi:hypothetical protein
MKRGKYRNHIDIHPYYVNNKGIQLGPPPPGGFLSLASLRPGARTYLSVSLVMYKEGFMKKPESEQKEYEAPAIVYEGKITTRAGSPEGAGDGVDPADLFGK